MSGFWVLSVHFTEVRTVFDSVLSRKDYFHSSPKFDLCEWQGNFVGEDSNIHMQKYTSSFM